MHRKISRRRWSSCGCGVVLVLPILLALSGCGSSQVSSIIPRLQDPDENVRYQAAKALEPFEDEAKPAAAQLATLLTDESARVRYRAAKVLSKIGRDARVAADPLCRALVDPDPKTRYFAAKTVDQFADEAKKNIADALTDALKDDKPQVRYLAAKALGKMGSTARNAVARLQGLASDQDASVRRAAASAIRKITKARS